MKGGKGENGVGDSGTTLGGIMLLRLYTWATRKPAPFA